MALGSHPRTWPPIARDLWAWVHSVQLEMATRKKEDPRTLRHQPLAVRAHVRKTQKRSPDNAC
eukprot:15450214-Alexandrium_andersonii.AAC.1